MYWKSILIDSINESIELELNVQKIENIISLGWIVEQINDILKDYSKCSYEVMYRQWYTFCLDLRKTTLRNNYNFIISFICIFIVPKLVVTKSLKNNITNFEFYGKMMNDLMLYPLNNMAPHDKIEWQPFYEDSNYTWYDFYDDLIFLVKSCEFWLNHIKHLPYLGEDISRLIVSKTLY
tara:strand:- start:721 stop:1257 length:537 start_codon:yes stop_codon:yes gene_type:complete